MFRRRPKNKYSYLVHQSSNRSSDIVKPENTSLIVNESDTEAEGLPRELTSILSEDEDDCIGSIDRKSSSLMKSLTQKTQSTPRSTQSSPNRVLKEINAAINQNLSKTFPKKTQPSKPQKTSSQPNVQKESFFEEILRQCGARKLPGSSSYLMSEDQAVFSLKLNKKLTEKNDNLNTFLKSFQEEIKNSENFQKLLVHTLTAEDCEVARGPVQEPILRMLLNVDCLQTEVLEIVLQKLANIIIDGEEKTEDVHIVPTVLRQIRFLNRVKNYEIAPKLFEIINVASIPIQREIIFMLPEVITEDEAEETATQLVDMLKFSTMLTHVIVDAITNLPLNEEKRSQIKIKVMNRLDKCPMEFLPSLVQFVLSRCEAKDVTEVVNGLRENLPFTLQHLKINNTKLDSSGTSKKIEEDSYLKLVFENIKFSVMASRQVADIWIKVISDINSSNDLKPLDLIILVIFYNCLFGRKNQILTIIRGKIKAFILTEEHVQCMFKIFLVVATEYSSAILELASILLKSFDQAIVDFGAVLYKEAFIYFQSYLEQTVVTEILLHIGTGTPGTVTTALQILKTLCEHHGEALSQHTMSIVGLLVKIPDLDAAQVRILIDVISELVFSSSNEINFGCQDELQMYIRKQLASSKLDQAKKGIAAAVMFAKHAVKNDNDLVSDVQVNSLLELAIGSNGVCETKRGFFNDEFASMIGSSVLRKSFLEYWKDKTNKMVMENLFVKNIDLTCEYFPMSLQYGIDEKDGNSVFPIVDFIIKSNSDTFLNIPVSIIPSSLKLLWSCEQSVSRLLPAFCASVIMPETTVFDKFNTFDGFQKKIVMDCLFLCANYLIECVNAFCMANYLNEALIRLKHLIDVRKLIIGHIHLASDYVPPNSQFYFPVQKPLIKKKNVDKPPRKGRKRKLEVSAETSNQTVGESQILNGTSASLEVAAPMQKSVEDVDIQGYRGFFRELTYLICNLLKADFRLGSKNSFYIPEKERWSRTEKAELNTCDLLFVLEDLNKKSEDILKETKRGFNFKSKTNVFLGKSTAPEDFISGAIKVLPKLLKKMERLSSYCKDLLEANDGVYDGLAMYPKDACDAKLALAASLKFISEIIGWQGFQNPNHKLLLAETLSILSKKQIRKEESSSIGSLSSKALEAANYLAGFSENVLILEGGLSIVKAFQACLRYASSEPQNSLAKLCYGLLCRPWFTVSGVRERGATYNQQIDFLLKTYFSSINYKLKTVCETAKVARDEVERLREKDSVMESLKSINKNNFPLLYRALCEALVVGATSELSKSAKDNQLSLETWDLITEILLVLVEIVKTHSFRVNLASLLKRSQSIVQLFLSKGMPVVESALRVQSVEVLKILKALQTVTRFLHSICCHSKITSDSVVAAHVPNIRSLCERLTLEVKGMLIVNEIPMDCITIAILKNRDLKGNDIITQETIEEESDDDSELPSENSQLDCNGIPEMDGTQESNSEAY